MATGRASDIVYSPGEWHLRYSDGGLAPLALDRWSSAADGTDIDLLLRCADPVLDVGCGPGRMVAALRRLGRPGLGVDIAPRAVELARRAGGTAIQASVFGSLPFEGRWGSVLLADGNIGIGGDPVRLLRRCRALLADNGTIVVELDPPGAPSPAVLVRLESPTRYSEWFRWAHVAVDVVDGPAEDAGLEVLERWTMEGRWFARLAG